MSQREDIKEESSQKTESFLGEILSTIENPLTTPITPETEPKEPQNTEVPTPTGNKETPVEEKTSADEKPKKKKLSTADFLRIIGAIFFVALVFFGTFLAYIVFNPGQTQFFIGLGINPGDIASFLKRLVSGIFGGTTFLLSIIWIIFLFRAFLTKKEYKKKKTISIILAVIFAILLFSEITLWAFLVQKINATDYENPNGGVVVYDNEKLQSEKFKNNATLNNFENLIGPLELKFDLKSNANFVGKAIDIEDYKIDFDGAKCRGKDSSIVEGINPGTDQSITCIFDEAKIYKPSGVYSGTDRVTRKKREIAINFDPIHIVGNVIIKKPKSYKDRTIVYDAKNLIEAGFRDISWYTEKDDSAPASKESAFSVVLKKDPQVVCLNVFPGANCDKIFLTPIESESTSKGKITYEQDKENPLSYTFRVENATVKNGEITGYEWRIDNSIIPSDEATCSYIFPEYKNTKVSVVITDSAGNTTELVENIVGSSPLKLTRSPHAESFLEILDPKDKSVLDNTYNKPLLAYVIDDLSMDVPTNLTFNATDVKVDNFGYELEKVEWDFDNDGTFEKESLKTQYELIEEKRYTIRVKYTFFNKDKNIRGSLEEKILIEPKKQDINLSMKLTQDSEYAPANIRVDGSASIPKKGSIVKFMYDF